MEFEGPSWNTKMCVMCVMSLVDSGFPMRLRDQVSRDKKNLNLDLILNLTLHLQTAAA